MDENGSPCLSVSPVPLFFIRQKINRTVGDIWYQWFGYDCLEAWPGAAWWVPTSAHTTSWKCRSAWRCFAWHLATGHRISMDFLTHIPSDLNQLAGRSQHVTTLELLVYRLWLSNLSIYHSNVLVWLYKHCPWSKRLKRPWPDAERFVGNSSQLTLPTMALLNSGKASSPRSCSWPRMCPKPGPLNSSSWGYFCRESHGYKAGPHPRPWFKFYSLFYQVHSHRNHDDRSPVLLHPFQFQHLKDKSFEVIGLPLSVHVTWGSHAAMKQYDLRISSWVSRCCYGDMWYMWYMTWWEELSS